MKLILLLGLLFFNSITNSYHALAESIIVIGEPFPKATQADGTGVQFEVVKAIFQPLGYEIKFSVYPYKRAIHLVENNQADMIVGIYKFATKKLKFPHHPQDADRMVAIFLKSKNIQWQGIKTLANTNIASTPGFEESITRTLKGIKYSLHEVSTHQQAFKKLVHRREDFMIDTEAVYSMEEINHYKAQLEKRTIGFFGIYPAFNLSDKSQKLQTIWQNTFPKFIKSAKAKALYLKWGLAREYEIINEYMDKQTAK